MSWVQQVHAKARILQDQIAHLSNLAERNGVDATLVREQIYTEIENIYATEFPLAKAMDESDIVFHLEGPALADHTPRLSLVESIFSNIRSQVFSVANAVAHLGDGLKISDKDVELSLSALVPGSLYVGIKAEPVGTSVGQPHIFGDLDTILHATREAIRSIGVLSQTLDQSSQETIDEVPDPSVRDAAMVAVAKLAPTGKRGVNRITISSTTEKGRTTSEVLTPKLRAELRRQLKPSKNAKFSSDSTKATLIGEIRELDLDFRRFELRRVKAHPNASVRCVLHPEADVRLATLAGKKVQVSGLASGEKDGAPTFIHVISVILLADATPPQNNELFNG
jgi:hypothetical protein